jgi:hypothetical protein
MRTLVVYYTDTGNTRRMAELLAAELKSELAEVTCARYLAWYGPVAMAWDIFTRHLPSVTVVAPPNGDYDCVVLGGPVWAAKAAPPILALATRWPDTRDLAGASCASGRRRAPRDRP